MEAQRRFEVLLLETIERKSCEIENRLWRESGKTQQAGGRIEPRGGEAMVRPLVDWTYEYCLMIASRLGPVRICVPFKTTLPTAAPIIPASPRHSSFTFTRESHVQINVSSKDWAPSHQAWEGWSEPIHS
jgi:hypothetical protein